MALCWIYVILPIMCNEVTSFVIRPCPVAYVGEPYKLQCKGRTNTDGSFIIWKKENKENQTNGEVSRCYLNSTCFTNSTSRYFVNMTSSYELQFSYTFASTFMILNVTEKDRGAVIYCGVIYEIPSLSEPETVMVCRLPVFDFTLPPSCHALLYMPDVSIVCDFQRVHPKVKCEFGYEANVFQPEVPVEYTVKTLTPTLPDYYNITCKGLLKFKVSYRTIYYVKFSPIYELYINEEGIKDHGRVQEVTLKLFPRVVINSPAYISICPPNLTNTMIVYCSATSSSPSVSLNLFVDNIQVMPQKPPRQLLSELYITMQEYTIQVDQNFQNKTLQCQREGFYNDSATVGIVIPPTSDPLFVLDGGMVIKHINVIPENSKISMKCLVNDGFPFVSNITVVCYFLNGTWHLKIHNASNFVFFTIYGKYLPLESYCICSAHHLSGCYTKNALLRISVNDANERVARSEDELYYEFIIYVAAALVIIILVSINIAMSVFFVRHRKSPNHHKNPYDDSTKIYDRVSKSTESQTYESPGETSMLSGSSLSVSTSDFVETLNNNHNPNQNMRFVNLKMASLEGINTPELPPRTKLCSDYEGNYITENSENAYQDTLKQSSEQRLTERQQIDDGKRLCSNKESTIRHKESVSTNSRAEKDFDNEHCIFYSQNYQNCEIPTNSFCYFDTPATETPKPQNKLGHGSGGKIYLEDPESNFSNEYSSTSEIKRIRESNRLRTDKKRSGKKKRSEYSSTSSEEMLPQTISNTRGSLLISSEEKLPQTIRNTRSLLISSEEKLPQSIRNFRRLLTSSEEKLPQTVLNTRSLLTSSEEKLPQTISNRRASLLTSSKELLSLTSSEEILPKTVQNTRGRFSTSSEEFLSQTIKNDRSNGTKSSDNERLCSHSVRKPQCKKRPPSETLSFKSSSSTLPLSHSDSCFFSESDNISDKSCLEGYHIISNTLGTTKHSVNMDTVSLSDVPSDQDLDNEIGENCVATLINIINPSSEDDL